MSASWRAFASHRTHPAAGVHGKAARHAAAKVLAVELTDRAGRLCDAKDQAFNLERNGVVTWDGQEIGQLEVSEDPLRPGFTLIADEHLPTPDKERIVKRVETWLANIIELRLKPLVDLSKADDLTGLARGIAFRLIENFGILRRETVAEEIRSLGQEARAELRKFGVRFGAYNIYFPLLLKPAAADLLLLLWALKQGGSAGVEAANLPEPPRQGLTSVPVDKALPDAFYGAAGFQVCGSRAIRIDMLERLADQIRPLTSWRPTEERPEPPAGAVGRGGFKIQPEMLSIIGCSSEEMGNVLFALGFRKERRPVEKKPEAAEAVPADTSGQAAPTTDEATASADHANGSTQSEQPAAETASGGEAIAEAVSASPVGAEIASSSTETGNESLPAPPAPAAPQLQPATDDATAEAVSQASDAQDLQVDSEDQSRR